MCVVVLTAIAFMTFSGIEIDKIKEGETSVYLTANDTRSVNTKFQSLILKRICMKMHMDNLINNIEWNLKMGRCREPLSHNETAEEDKLYFLLRGSKIHVSFQSRGDGNTGQFTIYHAKSDSEAEKLERRCNEHKEPESNDYECDFTQKQTQQCTHKVKKSGFYYLCSFFNNESTLQYTITINKLEYNTSNCHECNSTCARDTCHKCCSFSNFFNELISPECVYISTTSNDSTTIHHTTYIIENDKSGLEWPSGMLATAVLTIVLILFVFGYKKCKGRRLRITFLPDRKGYMPLR